MADDSRNTAIGCLVVVGILGSIGIIRQIANTSWEGKIDNEGQGKDPQAYATAARMYAGPERKTWDAAADRAARDVDQRLEKGATLLDPKVVQALAALEPYRAEAQAQAAVERWAAKSSGQPSPAEAPAAGARGKKQKAQPDELRLSAPEMFRTGTTIYGSVAGPGGAEPDPDRLEAVIEAFTECLKSDPLHLDARNDLALALMHAHRPLTAQVHLEMLRRMEPTYMPAAVNLVVAYEQCGQPGKARALALEVAKQFPKVPAVAFNAAWYHNLDGDYRAAHALLSPLMQLNPSERVAALHDLNRQQLLAKAGLRTSLYWQRGLVRNLGFTRTWWGWTLSIAGFLVAAWVFARLAGRIGRSGKGRFAASAAALAVWYGLTWGLPASVWLGWGLAVSFLLAFSTVGAVRQD